jgi:hypothetical protein
MKNRGGWIKTYSGVHFYPADPRLNDVNISDISHALSNQCRFSGHVSSFYSVSQHSVFVANIVADQGHPREVILAALLHDASESMSRGRLSPCFLSIR